MKQMLVSLLPFVIATFLHAAENPQCGLTLNNNFSAYSCPGTVNGGATVEEENVIKGIYRPGSTYTCITRTAGGVSSVVTQKRDCEIPSSVSNAYLSSAAQTIAKETTIMNNKQSSPIPADVYDLSGIYEDINTMIQDVKTSGGLKAINTSSATIDSHTNYEGTVPSILVGILTLDTDYFNNNGNGATLINSIGEVDLNPSMMSASIQEASVVNDLGNIVGKAIDWLFNEKNDRQSPDSNGVSNFNPMGFMDKQILGFYVYLVSNLLVGFIDIVYMIFMLGTMWAFGVYGYKKYMDKITGSNEFSVNKLSYLMTAAMGFAFFTAPVIKEEIDINGPISRAIYTDNAGHTTADNYGYSTLAQQAVRYAAQTGVYFANLEADYAMKAFYALLEFKQGMFRGPTDVGREFSEKLRGIKKDVYAASLAANYVTKVCRPYYGITGNFHLSAEQIKNYSSTTKNTAAIDAAGIKNVGRIDMQDCVDAYKTVGRLSNNIITAKATLLKEMETYEDLYKGGSKGQSTEQLKHTDFLKMLSWTQNNFGWMASVSPHSAYMFFNYVNLFEYKTDPDIQSEYFVTGMDNKIKADGGTNEDAVDDVLNGIESVTQSVANFTVGNAVWFVVPGFEGAMNFYEKQFTKLAFKGSTGELTTFGESIASFVSSIKSKIASMLMPGPVGKAFSLFFDTVSDTASEAADSGSGKYMALQAIITIASFIMAIMTISMVIATATIMIVTVFVTFKVIMYFVELIIFFVSAPVVGIYATVIGKEPKKYVENFVKHLGMLLVTPLMIVTASYIVLPITELFKSLFSALVMLVFRLFDKGQDLLEQDSFNLVDTSKKVIALAAMNGMAEIFAMIAVIFVSYIIIFNFQDWFTKIVGLDGVSETSKSALGEMKQSAQKYISPL